MKNVNKKNILIAVAALSLSGIILSVCKGKSSSTSCESCGN